MIFSRDRSTVVMTQDEFNQLPDYGRMIPSKMIPGKYWKTNFGFAVYGLPSIYRPNWRLGEYDGHFGIKWSKVVVSSIPKEP